MAIESTPKMDPTYTNRYRVSGGHPSYAWTSAAASFNPPMKDPDRFAAAMRHPGYPLTAAYDPAWVFEMSMGPVCLWLLEGLTGNMTLAPGMRVLDLGCGTAATSIFLAREFGVEVWATDLWIDPEDNRARIAEAGLGEAVHALRAEAHGLPFEPSFFDTIISIDAWHYFGTDVRYLAYLIDFLRPDGALGVVVPANAVDPDDPGSSPPPAALAAELGADWYTFRSVEWWRRHWSRAPGVAIDLAEMAPHGREDWLRHVEASEAHYGLPAAAQLDGRLLASETGAHFGFCRLVARRSPAPPG